MDEKCRTCTIKCRQADHIHETALGRMYAMNELLSYVKKVDNGELVEVIRCRDCFANECCSVQDAMDMGGDGYCPKGRRKDNA